jgi:hypothetical protein
VLLIGEKMIEFIQGLCEMIAGLFQLAWGLFVLALALVFLGALAAVVFYICGLGYSVVASVL